jgi:hypothetical protein
VLIDNKLRNDLLMVMLMEGPQRLATGSTARADWDSQKLSRKEVMREVRGSAGDTGPS